MLAASINAAQCAGTINADEETAKLPNYTLANSRRSDFFALHQFGCDNFFTLSQTILRNIWCRNAAKTTRPLQPNIPTPQLSGQTNPTPEHHDFGQTHFFLSELMA
jgi:hypothetical protein